MEVVFPPIVHGLPHVLETARITNSPLSIAIQGLHPHTKDTAHAHLSNGNRTATPVPCGKRVFFRCFKHLETFGP
eukprot:scaffold72250_cov63-Attheya_sp.AAC.1